MFATEIVETSKGRLMFTMKQFMRDQKGATSTVLALSIPVILGSFVMIMEVGYWFFAKAELQSTADMAALAGAKSYAISEDKSTSKNAVSADARANAFNAMTGTMDVNIPPSSGSFAGKSAVQVEISQSLPTFFVHIFRDDPILATVSAVAAIRGEKHPACIIALATSGTGISIGGNVDVGLTGCVMHSNSTSNTAINVFGSSELEADCTSSVGGQSLTSSVTLNGCDGAKENVKGVSDPFAHLGMPANLSSMPCLSATTSGNGNNKKTTMPIPSGGVVRMCSDVNLKGDVTLAPGTYVFDGADLDFASKATLTGTDVTILFTNGGGLGQLNNNNGLDLSAPSTGTYAGMVMMADRLTTPNETWTMNGQADVSLNGAVYLPTIDLRYAGGAGSNSTGCTQLVTNSVTFRGNSGFAANCDALGLDPIEVEFTSDIVQLVE